MSNPYAEKGISRPPRGYRGAARAARNAAIRGEDMPTLPELSKRVPVYVEVVRQGRDGRPYRRFFYQSVADPNYFHCIIQSDERGMGELPAEGETLILYPMNRIWINEATMMYETDQAFAVIARDVTYSGPDSSKVARMNIKSTIFLPSPAALQINEK